MAYEPPAPGNSGYAQIDDIGRADADGVDTGGAGISFVDLPAFLTEDEPAAAAGDADAVIAHVGEIGKPHPARRVLLPEDDVLLGPVQCPPGTDAPLQGAANTDADLGMAAPDLV